MKRFALLLPLALLARPPLPALAHPGGLNAEGCHNNRKTGEYHCHRNRRTTQPAPTAQLQGGVYFPNCTAARQAGAAPIYRGQPGYRPALDREPYRGR